jgi:hypothetical protein
MLNEDNPQWFSLWVRISTLKPVDGCALVFLALAKIAHMMDFVVYTKIKNYMHRKLNLAV